MKTTTLIPKKELRQEKLRKLKKFKKNSGVAKLDAENNLQNQLFNSNDWQNSEYIALTCSLDFEIDTSEIIKRGLAENKKILVPKIGPNQTMNFHQINDQTTWNTDHFNIKEPNEDHLISALQIDLIIVPGLVFNDQGYRIGFGGGFFDRFLQSFTGKTLSLAFSWQKSNDWQPDQFDQPVQKIIWEEVDEENQNERLI